MALVQDDLSQAKEELHRYFEWMSKLKYIHRNPLNLHRIPPELLMNILSRDEITNYRWAPDYRHVLGEMRTFRDWADLVLVMIDYKKLEEIDPQLNQELKEVQKNRTRNEIKTINWHSIPVVNLDSIINRTNVSAAVRLRQANRCLREQVDSAFVEYYPASVLFGQLDDEMPMFEGIFMPKLTINGNCRAVIDCVFLSYRLTRVPTAAFSQTFDDISPQLHQLTADKEERDEVENCRWKKEWECLGYIPKNWNFVNWFHLLYLVNRYRGVIHTNNPQYSISINMILATWNILLNPNWRKKCDNDNLIELDESVYKRCLVFYNPESDPIDSWLMWVNAVTLYYVALIPKANREREHEEYMIRLNIDLFGRDDPWKMDQRRTEHVEKKSTVIHWHLEQEIPLDEDTPFTETIKLSLEEPKSDFKWGEEEYFPMKPDDDVEELLAKNPDGGKVTIPKTHPAETDRTSRKEGNQMTETERAQKQGSDSNR